MLTAACWAHPRSRGEHQHSSRCARRRSGSSPLARGTPAHSTKPASVSGLIPARAGNTSARVAAMMKFRAHPRSRGEHCGDTASAPPPPGSSPLARGTRAEKRGEDYAPGLIPARAGNTLADMGLYPLHQQNRITLEPESASRIHDKQPLLTPASTTISTRLTPPRFRHRFTNNRTIN